MTLVPAEAISRTNVTNHITLTAFETLFPPDAAYENCNMLAVTLANKVATVDIPPKVAAASDLDLCIFGRPMGKYQYVAQTSPS